MILIITRHAHRDATDRHLDNGLSEKGRRQAQELKERLLEFLGNEKPSLLSSPRLRCQETLQPLASALGLELKIDERLDEQGNEDRRTFESRIVDFLESLETIEGPLIICSHGDWIPVATYFLLGESLELEKSGWVVFQRNESGKFERKNRK